MEERGGNHTVGYHMIMKKFVIIILVNIFFNVFVLSLGGHFLLITFLMGIANLVVITLFCKKENRQQTALLSLILALFLTVIPIVFAYLFGDAGAVAFMIVFTFFFVTIPLLFFSVLTFFRKQKEDKQNAENGSLS